MNEKRKEREKNSESAKGENKEGVKAALTLLLYSRVVSIFYVTYTDTDVSALKLCKFVCIVALAAL